MASNEWVIFKGTATSSCIWIHFYRSIDKKSAKCKKCDKILKNPATATLKYHIEKVHHIQIQSQSDQLPEETLISNSTKNSAKINNQGHDCNKQASITSFFKPEPKNSARSLARLAAEDNIPFHTIAKSSEIRAGFCAQGMNIPLTGNGVKKAVFGYADELREKYKKFIREKIDMDERFSISFDEYTSIKNQRYFKWPSNIAFYFKKSINIFHPFVYLSECFNSTFSL